MIEARQVDARARATACRTRRRCWRRPSSDCRCMVEDLSAEKHKLRAQLHVEQKVRALNLERPLIPM